MKREIKNGIGDGHRTVVECFAKKKQDENYQENISETEKRTREIR